MISYVARGHVYYYDNYIAGQQGGVLVRVHGDLVS